MQPSHSVTQADRLRAVTGLPDLLQRQAPGEETLVGNAALGGTVPLWDWIGDEPATTFSY